MQSFPFLPKLWSAPHLVRTQISAIYYKIFPRSIELKYTCQPLSWKTITCHVQFTSVPQSCPTLWWHGLHHASHLCPSPAPRAYLNSCPSSQGCQPNIWSSVIPSPAFKLSQLQGVFQRAISSHQVAKVLEFQLQRQSFQGLCRTDFL